MEELQKQKHLSLEYLGLLQVRKPFG